MSDSSPETTTKRPAGSIANPRDCLSVGVLPMKVSLPVAPSRGADRIKAVEVEQIARVRNGDVVRIPAVAIYAEEARLSAEVLVAAPADRAGPAADPRVDEAHVARADAASLGPDGDDLACRLVPERQGHRNAPVLQRHPAAEAEVVAAFPDVQVAVANSGRSDAKQDLRPGRFGRPALDGLERRPEIHHAIAFLALPCEPLRRASPALRLPAGS